MARTNFYTSLVRSKLREVGRTNKLSQEPVIEQAPAITELEQELPVVPEVIEPVTNIEVPEAPEIIESIIEPITEPVVQPTVQPVVEEKEKSSKKKSKKEEQ